ncbi:MULTISPECIES: MaoC family dehydratase [Bradyrhizobium]|uniref:L-erythro-3-methylmalyl-CoA dehydratase n=2 Tax=Bradyrhizobium TaxID=374 RepID=A0ABY0PJC3_9BRAD|nr:MULTISPECIES: MaoC family dehydratase [Bradyrhizobium]SDI19508.1 L-erythro-3-methylmalyl-CoA dehydratase [Bradyrhizobium ottawaense]SED74941.1 L-erythro-3-methylmalyl-CoA dehydratase [Bradyrhizobium lablabi]SHL70555.1 L-erythro-3-methylmalyl-CoA dehydratase [Bradyrhizobium lablabi]
MKKGRAGNHFEDFRCGMKIQHATPRTLTEGDRSLYIGLTGSRAVLGTAETNAQQLGFERRPLEDLLVFNTAFGKTVPDISLNAVANLGYADVRFLADVYPGDTLVVESEIIGLKENSNRKSGVVYVRSTAANQHGLEVLSWIRWVMVHKRDHGAASAEPVVPAMNAVVSPGRLPRRKYAMDVREIVTMTGTADLWDDYAIGERIDHPGAMTINDSDHSIATRLYQNTARAHFDGFAMAAAGGQRLVFGGHIISLCKALSYDGLENGLSIVAINGGTHVNPTFTGDTIACATMVLDKIILGVSNVGALRLRMIGIKDSSASSIVFPHPGQARQDYPSNVVLDLDYTIVIPKKS